MNVLPHTTTCHFNTCLISLPHSTVYFAMIAVDWTAAVWAGAVETTQWWLSRRWWPSHTRGFCEGEWSSSSLSAALLPDCRRRATFRVSRVTRLRHSFLKELRRFTRETWAGTKRTEALHILVGIAYILSLIEHPCTACCSALPSVYLIAAFIVPRYQDLL